jgi:hypothetical protein
MKAITKTGRLGHVCENSLFNKNKPKGKNLKQCNQDNLQHQMRMHGTCLRHILQDLLVPTGFETENPHKPNDKCQKKNHRHSQLHGRRLWSNRRYFGGF